VLILSTLAFGAVFGAATVTVAFETIVLEGAPAFGETLTMDAAPALIKDFAGAAFTTSTLDEAAIAPFDATGAFRGIAFQPDAFARFPVGPAPASLFLFFIASLLALEPRAKRGP
jgi:hypothetical protein